MSKNFDAVVIGAGHNGLVTAVILSKSGQKVLVLEARPTIGGAAATEEIFPGFHVNTGAGDASLFRDEIVAELGLEARGLAFQESEALLFAPQPDGNALTLWRDEARTRAEIERFSPRDAERYPAFCEEVKRIGGVLGPMMLAPPPDLAELKLGDVSAWGKIGLKTRRLGDREMMQFMRVLPMPISDYLNEWFESAALKGALGAAGVIGMRQGPRAAGTALRFFYQHARGLHARRVVAGGMGKLAAALASAAQQNGAEIRTSSPVARILLDGDKAIGVALADGTEIGTNVVVSNADPRRTLFGLVGPQHLEPRFMRKVRNIIYRGSVAKLNLALNGLPEFVGQGSEGQLHGRIRIAPSLDYLERAYDAAKYGRISPHPFLDVAIPTLLDPALAPDGRHVMSITMQYAPYALDDGNWNDERERLGDAIIATLNQYAPNLQSLILNRQIITPLDWEQKYGLTEGSIMHGQMGLDQLLVMRPVAGWSRYETPIANLYLCGAGAHPGGGVTGAPGYNAAREILKKG